MSRAPKKPKRPVIVIPTLTETEAVRVLVDKALEIIKKPPVEVCHKVVAVVPDRDHPAVIHLGLEGNHPWPTEKP